MAGTTNGAARPAASRPCRLDMVRIVIAHLHDGTVLARSSQGKPGCCCPPFSSKSGASLVAMNAMYPAIRRGRDPSAATGPAGPRRWHLDRGAAASHVRIFRIPSSWENTSWHCGYRHPNKRARPTHLLWPTLIGPSRSPHCRSCHHCPVSCRSRRFRARTSRAGPDDLRPRPWTPERGASGFLRGRRMQCRGTAAPQRLFKSGVAVQHAI